MKTIYQVTRAKCDRERNGCGEFYEPRLDVRVTNKREATKAFNQAIRASDKKVIGEMRGSRMNWTTDNVSLLTYHFDESEAATKFLAGEDVDWNSGVKEGFQNHWESEQVEP